jgi:hypothetical protein
MFIGLSAHYKRDDTGWEDQIGMGVGYGGMGTDWQNFNRPLDPVDSPSYISFLHPSIDLDCIKINSIGSIMSRKSSSSVRFTVQIQGEALIGVIEPPNSDGLKT